MLPSLMICAVTSRCLDASRKLNVPLVMRALGWIWITVKVPPLSKMRIKLSILWPHELFAYMYHGYKLEFIRRLCGGAVSNISNFWAS